MGSSIKIRGTTLRGVFQARRNRFLVYVKVAQETVPSFFPNPGRMQELLTAGTEVLLKKVENTNRKTAYDLIGVLHHGQLVSVDSRVPNQLVGEALHNRDIAELAEYDTVKPEYRYGHTRFDFLLTHQEAKCLLEVKSCTLVRDGVALFPDAETRRGRRHVNALVTATKEGYRASILFVVQRTDAHRFAPNDATDPKFGAALRSAATEGVDVYAYSSEFLEDRITLQGPVMVDLAPPGVRER